MVWALRPYCVVRSLCIPDFRSEPGSAERTARCWSSCQDLARRFNRTRPQQPYCTVSCQILAIY